MASNDSIVIAGTLLQDAQVRTKPMGDSETPMPVLCLLIESDGPSAQPVRAEQTYPPSHRSDAEKAARALRRGTRVSVTAPLAHMRVALGFCTAIHIPQPSAGAHA